MFSLASVDRYIHTLYIYRYVCDQLPGANSSPIVTKRVSHTLGHGGRGD